MYDLPIYLMCHDLSHVEQSPDESDKHLGLRIDSETHGKLKSLAEFEGRSINGEVLYLIRQAIAQHEKNHGTLNK